MIDITDKATRSRIMAAIRSKDTKPEKVLRKALHAKGFRYRLNAKGFPGSPDLLFPKFGAAVFVHGCFWHRHESCRRISTPSTRRDYWQDKFAKNVARDRTVVDELADSNWRVAIVWECALIKRDYVGVAADLVAGWLRSDEQSLEIGEEHVSS